MQSPSEHSTLALNLLDTPKILLDGEQIQLPSSRAQALLIYLAVTGTSHRRNELAALLWDDGEIKRVRARLRKTLQLLRRRLNTALAIQATAPYSVGLRSGLDLTVDVAEFERLTAPDANEVELHRALKFYRGDFLAGFNLVGASEFEHWMGSRRQDLRERLYAASVRLVQYDQANAQWAHAIQLCRNMLSREPWREEVHRKLIELLAQSGNRAGALAHYQICYKALDEELSVEPDQATQALIAQIRDNQIRPSRLKSVVAIVPGTNSSVQFQADLLDAPTTESFVGRRIELAQLSRWIVQDRCRVAAVLGIGGMGKTSLAAHFVSSLVQQSADENEATRPFDKVVWRSLVNAPPLEELLPECLHCLGQPAAGSPALGLEGKLRLLSESFNQQRCLLILDNFESIMQAGARAGHYRRGYENYDQLLDRAAQGEHRSCLLLTSRERPPGLGRRANDGEHVRLLELPGLDGTAVQEILHARGLAGRPAEVRRLIEAYAGNPLAVKLAADTINELYAAQVSAFLQSHTVIFDNMRDLLRSQFQRLSVLERSIMLWLAIKREPASINDLARALFPAPFQADLLDALRSLQRRSLVDVRPALTAGKVASEGGMGNRFALQNMLMEFLTDYFVQTVARELRTKQPDYLDTHALIEASAKEYVRNSQTRLILAPIAESLLSSHDGSQIRQRLTQLLNQQRQRSATARGYLAGNVLNLLCHVDGGICGADFSNLTLRQASLQRQVLQDVDFRHSTLVDVRFTDVFDLIGPLAFHPDGRLFAAGTAAGRILLWRIDEGQIHLALSGHAGGVRAIDFAPDGRTLISGSVDQSVRLWDTDSGKLLRVFDTHTGRIRAVCFSPDGTHCASGGDDGTVRLWDSALGREVAVLTQHRAQYRGRVGALCFSPDGRNLASGGSDGAVLLWAITGEERVRELFRQTGAVNALAFSPDGEILASAGADSVIRLLDSASGRIQCVMAGHEGQVNSVDFSPNGRTLVSAGEDGTVRLWDAMHGAPQRILHGHSSWVWSAVFDPAGAVVVSGGVDRTIRLWDATDGRILQTLHGYTDGIRALDFSPDGRHLVTAGSDELIRLWDLAANREQFVLPEHVGWVNAICFTPDGARLISGGEDRVARLHDAHIGRPLSVSYAHGEWISALCLNARGDVVATGGVDGRIKLWQVAQGNQLFTLEGHTSAVNGLTYAHDDHLLVSAGDDRTIRLWDARTGALQGVLQGHAMPVWAVAFYAAERLLASGGTGRTICLWDRASLSAAQSGTAAPLPRRLALPMDHGAIRALAFSPSAPLLASGDDAGSVILWDVETGDIAHVLHGHSGRINDLAFRLDGLHLASASDDGAAIVWDASSGQQVQTVRPDRPYERMNIDGATGITAAQRASLIALGAIVM